MQKNSKNIHYEEYSENEKIAYLSILSAIC